MSSVVQNAFTSIVQNLEGTEDIKVIRKVAIKLPGERDFSAQEIMHHIMSLKLVSSSFHVVNLSLDGSHKISIKSNNVEIEPSTPDNYAMRNTLLGCCNAISQCNLVKFVANYFVVKSKTKKRQKQVVVRAFPTPYSNPKGVQYPSFCKYQLIKYKPWNIE